MYSIQIEKFQNIFNYYSCMVLNVLGGHLIRIWTTSEMSHWYFRTLCILSRDTNFVKPHRVQYLKQLDNYYADLNHIPFSIKKELWLWTVLVGRETLHKPSHRILYLQQCSHQRLNRNMWQSPAFIASLVSFF